MKASLRWIVGSLPLAVLALILATLAWVVAAEEADPTRTERYPQPIPVTPSGLPEGMVIVGQFDEEVQVTVRAPESVWRTIRLGDFSATVDLTGLEAGTHELPISIDLRKQPSHLAWEPGTLILELAPWAQEAVPVVVQIEGEPALGYLTGRWNAVPRFVTVDGPKSCVDRVIEAVTQVSVQGADADVEGAFSLQPVDGQGQAVPDVTLTPPEVDVRVPIELSGYYRPMTVRVDYTGSPASGYHITYIAVEPSTVIVRGAPGVIAALPGYVETESIDLEGAQDTVIRQPALHVPSNVTVVSGQPVTVTVVIEAIPGNLTMEITPTLQGLEPGLTATVSPDSVEVFLSGPLPQLNALRPGDVRIVLDLVDRQPGTYQIEPQVVVPGGVTVQSVLPTSVQVEIAIPPTSAPTPRPPISPIPTPTED